MTDFDRRLVVRGRVYEFDTREERDAALARAPERLRGSVAADSAEAAAERRAARRFGDSPVRAGLAAAARGATLGLSDTALTETGLVDPETLRELERRNIIASSIGELGGAVAPVLLAGPLGGLGELAEGGSLLARGARIATAPVRGLTALAEGAGGAVAERLAGTGAGLGRRLLARGAGLATEGAIDGAVSEAARMLTTERAMGYDPDLTAESLMGRLGTGALLGAGVGGVLGGMGGAVGEGVRAGRALTGATADTLSRAFRDSTGTELSPSIARLLGTVSGRDPDVIRRGLLDADPAFRRTIARGDAIYSEGTDEMRRAVSDMENARAAAVRHWATGGLRVGHLENAVNPARLVDQAAIARDAAERARNLAEQLVTDGAAYGPSVGGHARRFRDTINARVDDLETALANERLSDTRRSAEIFSTMDRIKRDLGEFQRRLGRSGGEATDMARREYETLIPALEDATMWGDDAAAMQRTVNAAYSRELTTRGRYADRFLETGGTNAGRSDFDPFDVVGQGDSARIAAFLNQAGTAANATAEQTFSETVDSTRRLLAAMNDHMELPARERRLIERALRAADTAEEVFGRVRNEARDLNQWREFERGGSIERAIFGATVGAGVGGPIGAVAAGVLANPALAIRTRGMVERIAGGVVGDVSDGVRRFLSGAASAAGRAARTAARRTARASVLGGVNAYRDRIRRLDEESNVPARTIERIAGNTTGLDAVPEVRDALIASATRASTYLQRTRPTTRAMPGEIRPRSSALPSRTEMDRFLRRARAVDDPLSLINDMESGHVTREAVEAVREVYPQLYARIRSEVMRQVTEHGDDMSYSRRLALGILMDLPTVPSLAPTHMAEVQAMHASAVTTPSAPTPHGSAPDLGAGFASGMDALAQRRAA